MRRRLSIALLATASIVSGFVGASPARAGAIAVTRFDDPAPGACDPGDCSLREGIMAANAAPGANSIQLEPGTYVLSHGPVGDDSALNGDLDIVDTLTLRGAGPSRTFLDGGGLAFGDRILHVQPGRTLIVSSLTVRNAGATVPGVVRAETGSTLSVTDAAISDNVASDRPGLFVDGATTQLTRVSIERNTTASGCCPGIDTAGGGSLTMTDVTIRGNTSGSCCAGLATAGGTDLDLTRVIIDRNSSGSCCAGLATAGDGTLSFRDMTVSNNMVTGGCCAGVALSGSSTATFTNVTVSGNSSDGCCVGLATGGSTVINGATVVNNVADSDGSGDCCAGLVQNGPTTISNSILAGNRVGATPDDCSGTVTSAGYNIIQVGGICLTTGDTTGNILGADPRLGPLTDNGGSVPTHALLRGSPALNAGSPARPGSGGSACDPADARGAPRKNCDIGAYELVRCAGTVVNRVGTAAKDTLRGTNRKDGMIGLGGRDTLIGKGGKDALCGGGGKDKLKGGGGKDALIGQAGNDQCIGGPSSDRVKGCEREKSV